MRRVRLLSFAAVLAGVALASSAEDWARDPVRVYWDGAACVGPEIDLEVWDREARRWVAHPDHPRVRTPSCEIEDAGVLLNELRWRCAGGSGAAASAWRFVDVFDADRMSSCAVGSLEPDPHRPRIEISAPPEHTPVRASEPWVTLAGRVAFGGAPGSDVDVVLLVDRAAPDGALAAQVAALRHFLRRTSDRLGTLRVALLSHPNRSPRPGESPGFRRELDWSDDAAALEAAVGRLRPARALASLPAALGAALGSFSQGRPGARRVIAAMVDGRLIDDAARPADAALAAVLARAREAGAELHWFALGGLASEAPGWLRGEIEERHGSFQRIAPHRYGTSFLSVLRVPVVDAVWVEARGERADAQLEAGGGFRARVALRAGANPLVVHARTRDGARLRRPYTIVFDDSQLPERVLERERERIHEARRKRLELRVDPPDAQ